MNKLIPMLLLVGLSTNVFAEWTTVSSGGEDIVKGLYVDLETKKKYRGGIVEMWDLFDLNHPDEDLPGDKKLSFTDLSQYDCKAKTRQIVSANDYAKNMGYGKILYTRNRNQPGNVVDIMPGSYMETLFNIACDIK